MADKVKPGNFYDWCMENDIQWEGRYDGKFYHKGWAIIVRSEVSLGIAMAHMASDRRIARLATRTPHIDNMGKSIVASWDIYHFEEEDKAYPVADANLDDEETKILNRALAD